MIANTQSHIGSHGENRDFGTENKNVHLEKPLFFTSIPSETSDYSNVFQT